MHRWLLPLLLVVVGCGDRRATPFLGKWHGAFVVKAVDQGTRTPLSAQAWSYRADLIIYVRKFELRLDGPQQGIVVRGTYEVREGRGITLRPTTVTIDDGGGIDKRNPNLPYYPNDATTAFFSRPIPLRLSGESKLEGVRDRWANVSGALEITRDE
ncbi:MAG: hypothetical protein C4320_05645 [Armatimonadota bacterium]